MFKGFFNRMYNGNPNRPDIDPEDMPKNRFELFFTTLGIRVGDLIKLNLITAIALIPVIGWTLLSSAAFMAGLASESGVMIPESEIMDYTLNQLALYLIGLLIALPLAGPPLAGMTYVARNYARDEHAWLWSDFKEQTKKNWKQSMAVMLILAAVLMISFITLQLYSAAMQDQPWMWVMQLLFIIFIGIFILSYMYVFPMLVTYKLKLGQVIRNSLMLALGRLPFTLMFGFMSVFPVVLAFILVMANFSIINFVVLGLVIYYLVLGIALTSFIINSYTNATFDKLLKTDEKPKDPEDFAGQDKP